jgi:hypothetical protein
MSRNGWISSLLIMLALASFPAQAKVIDDPPGSLAHMQTIADAIESSDTRPVHILYIHGINAVGADDSKAFRDSLCTIVRLCASAWQNAGTEFPDKRAFAIDAPPPPLEYLGVPIWSSDNNAEEWRASAPFVTHYVVQIRGKNALLVVDEVNWWPIVLDLKCRKVLPSDTFLAGPNPSLLNFCAAPRTEDKRNPGRFTSYDWLTPAEAHDLARQPNHAVLINRNLKTGLEDWGFSDVLLGVGPLRPLLEDGILQLIVKSAAFNPHAEAGATTVQEGRKPYDWQRHKAEGEYDQQFIAVTHSMGSFLLLDTLDLDIAPESKAPSAPHGRVPGDSPEDRALAYVVERTSQIYFFANQVLELELAHLTSPVAPSALLAPQAQPAPAPNPPSQTELLSKWAQMRAAFQQKVQSGESARNHKMQVIAFSDPSDLLTWREPPLHDVDVVNVYVQNATHWFWVFESPMDAHDNYATNRNVLKVMFGK